MSEASVEQRLEALDRALGVSFRDPELREASVTHRSFAFEHDLTITLETVSGLTRGDRARLRAAREEARETALHCGKSLL